MIWSVVVIVVLVGIISLAVDLGRVQVAKSEMQAAVDASARHAAQRFILTNGNINEAITGARNAAGDNRADGATVSLSGSGNTSNDVQFLNYNSATRTYTTLNGNNRSSANAIRIATQRQVPLLWGSILGRSHSSVRVEAIASTSETAYIPVPGDRSATVNVNGEASVWYAGMPASSTPFGGYGDTATRNKPVQVTIPGDVISGDELTFTNTSGDTWPSEWIGMEKDPNKVPSHLRFPTDGHPSFVYSNNNFNGISGMNNGRSHALVGVFLNDNAPNTSNAPGSLDFSGNARNYTTLSPQLKQVFLIGDGLTDSGTQQKVIVPQGATRLYLGVFDVNGLYTHNGGSKKVTINARTPQNIAIIR